MSRDDLDDFDSEITAPKKKSMSVDKFFQQFNTLDTNNFGSWPLSVKITCWIFLFFVVCAIGYFLAIQPKLEAIDQARAQEQSLLKEYQEKESKHRNLQQYQAQLRQMEANFIQQLQLLPKDTEIPSLVEDINRTGVTAGLKFKNIRLESEVTQEFFIEQPISIEATGDYHAFGMFVSAVAALQRIVTLHDFELTATSNKDSTSDIPTTDYKIQAKTYRYVATANDLSTLKPENQAVQNNVVVQNNTVVQNNSATPTQEPKQ